MFPHDLTLVPGTVQVGIPDLPDFPEIGIYDSHKDGVFRKLHQTIVEVIVQVVLPLYLLVPQNNVPQFFYLLIRSPLNHQFRRLLLDGGAHFHDTAVRRCLNGTQSGFHDSTLSCFHRKDVGTVLGLPADDPLSLQLGQAFPEHAPADSQLLGKIRLTGQLVSFPELSAFNHLHDLFCHLLRTALAFQWMKILHFVPSLLQISHFLP